MSTIESAIGLKVKNRKVRLADSSFRFLCLLSAILLIGIVVVCIFELGKGGAVAFKHQGISFITGEKWDPSNKTYGSLALIWGTVVASILALLFGGTTGVLVSAYVVELAPKMLLKPITFLVDLLAAIPSIIYGLWGIQVLIPWLQKSVYPELFRSFGWTNLFGTSTMPAGKGVLTAGLVLGIMIIPTVAAVTREMLLVVPKSMRDGALALGANKTEALKGVQVPYAIGGILGGLILGLGRALGETMAVAMLIGNSATISRNLFQPAATLSSMIANSFPEADAEYRSALIGLGLILFVLTLAINILARYLVFRVRRRSGIQ